VNDWWVFLCAPNKERRGAEFLRMRGFEADVPVWRRFVRGSRTIRGTETVRLVPVLPGYLFVALPSPFLINRVLRVQYFNGEPVVRSPMRVAGEPGKVSPEEMARFKTSIDKLPATSSVKHSVKMGDVVRVKNGKYADKTASVGMVEGLRLTIETEFFNRITLAVVSLQDVELADTTETTPKNIAKSLQCGANQSTRYAQGNNRSAGRIRQVTRHS
jgi:transcription antitermination factor NusG